MVQGKPARKKPKDPGAVPTRGGGPGPGSRGGAMMAPGPATLPNYMRATSCSGAKAGASGASASPQPQQGRAPKVVLTTAAAVPRAGRATCSSAMKGTGVGGPAHACPYAYCSFRGHAHAPAPQPLGSFVAERRRLIKRQQSMKLKGASPFRKPGTGVGGGRGGGYLVEIHAGSAAPTVTSDVSCSDVSAEDALEGLGAAASGDDDSCGSSDVISVGSVELLLGTTEYRHREEKKTLVEVVDREGEDFGAGKSDVSDDLGANHGGNLPEGGVGDAPKESSVDSISSSLSGISFEEVSSGCAYAASSEKKNRSSIARRRRTSEQDVKQMRPFRPKPPNFLPAKTGPKAEKVDLNSQTSGGG